MRQNFYKSVSVLLFIFFLSFVSGQVLGQGKYLKGYVVSVNGDTLKGQIRYEDWDVSPSLIDFSDKNGVIQKVRAEDSKSFFVSDVDITIEAVKLEF